MRRVIFARALRFSERREHHDADHRPRYSGVSDDSEPRLVWIQVEELSQHARVKQRPCKKTRHQKCEPISNRADRRSVGRLFIMRMLNGG